MPPLFVVSAETTSPPYHGRAGYNHSVIESSVRGDVLHNSNGTRSSSSRSRPPAVVERSISSSSSSSSSGYGDPPPEQNTTSTPRQHYHRHHADHHHQEQQHVRFAFVEVIRFDIVLGDNPSVTIGPAVALGTQVLSQMTIDIDQYEYYRNTHVLCRLDDDSDGGSGLYYDDDPYGRLRSNHRMFGRSGRTTRESDRKRHDIDDSRHNRVMTTIPHRRYGDDLVLTLGQRADLLLLAGYTTQEIIDAGNRAQRDRRERIRSFRDGFRNHFHPMPVAAKQNKWQQFWNNTGRNLQTIFCSPNSPPPVPVATTGACGGSMTMDLDDHEEDNRRDCGSFVLGTPRSDAVF